MNLGEALARVMAKDPRYAIQAYAFVFEALEFTKQLRRRVADPTTSTRRGKTGVNPLHVTGQELCEGARQLAREQYGMLAVLVLEQWGIHSTSDLGEIVYNMIASGDMEKTPDDSRSDFDDVYDFATAFEPCFNLQETEPD